MIKKRLSAMCALIFSCGIGALAQGPLLPPGPPGPMMKTLDQVEPGTPITYLPTNIAVEGSYYLTGNLTGVSGSNGIVIATNNINIDLRGFSLIGVPGSLNGVSVASGVFPRRISVRNGTIRNWGSGGLAIPSAREAIIAGISCTTNGSSGISAGVNAIVSDCCSSGNGGAGVVADASIVRDTSSLNNDSDGFSLVGGVAENCRSDGNGGDGFNTGVSAIIRDCIATGNDLHGIDLSSQCMAIGNHASANGGTVTNGAGIRVRGADSRIEGNHLLSNDIGIHVATGGCFVVRNTCSGNTTNYFVSTNSAVAQIVNVQDVGVFTNLNPWANFSF